MHLFSVCGTIVRQVYIVIGVVFVGLGFIGVFLPILPTTPFLIIAVWAFSKGSPRLERWLLKHPKFGPLVRDWRAHRVIPLRAKLFAWLMMVASFSYLMWFSTVPTRYVLMAGATMLAGAIYIGLKPSQQPPNHDSERPSSDNSKAPPSDVDDGRN